MSFKTGNKLINLNRLKEYGFNVPEFIAAPPDIDETDLLAFVKKAMPHVNLFAVRSSSPDEDTPGHSNAGKFYSAIAVKRHDLYKEYCHILASYGKIRGEVIIQRFIPGKKSGVLFTDNGSKKSIINANLGICKYVVEGKTCDEFIVDPQGHILSKFIPLEKEFLSYRNYSLKIAKTTRASLSTVEINELVTTGKHIQQLFGGAQDIEWCYYRRKLFILQTRPVTRSIPEVKELTHYDSANIAESYSGLVLPLTLSFARHIYEVVYENLLHASGVSREKLQKYKPIFENMVHWFYGRLYYNMNNWYRMMAFIPGYQRNKENLENMITSNIRLNIDRTILPPPAYKLTYPLIVFMKLLWFGFSQHIFKKRVKGYLKTYREPGFFENLFFTDCRLLYKEFNRKLISEWHIPVENDFMVMTFFGLLQKRLSVDSLQKAICFMSKTGKQIEELIKLKDIVFADADLRIATECDDPENFKISAGNNRKLQEHLKTYYTEYGGRFANELKLESEDIEEDIGKLMKLLKLYGNRKSGKVKNNDLADFGSLYNRFLVRRFRKYAAQRESMRLLRSNGFSVVRKLFGRIGEIFAQQKIISKAEDIYYLYIEEIFEKRSGYQELIKQRKEEYDYYKTVTPPAFFTIADGEEPALVDSAMDSSPILYGRACNAGIIKGKVKVFEEFSLPEVIDFDIVVAQHTDPGWTPLLGVAGGLIVENGGILSHAAIVSRELGIPTIIGVANATSTLQDGMEIEMNGDTGLIQLIHAS